MPRQPNFAIPASPSPPPSPTSATAHKARTAKAEKFLRLKGQGTHFHARLGGSVALRDPGLLGKLLAFVGLEGQEQYESCLPAGTGVATTWGEEEYVEELVRANEAREKARTGGRRDGVEFVAERKRKG